MDPALHGSLLENVESLEETRIWASTLMTASSSIIQSLDFDVCFVDEVCTCLSNK